MVVHHLEILYFKCASSLCYCLSHSRSPVSGYAVFWTDMQFFCGGYAIFCFVYEIKPFSSGHMVHIFQAAAKTAYPPQEVTYLLRKTDYRLTVLKTMTQTLTASEVHLLYFSIECLLNCFMLQCNHMNFQSEVHFWSLTFYILLLTAKLRSLVNVSLRNVLLSLRESFKID